MMNDLLQFSIFLRFSLSLRNICALVTLEIMVVGVVAELIHAKRENRRAEAPTRAEKPEPKDSIAPLKSVKLLSPSKNAQKQYSG